MTCSFFGFTREDVQRIETETAVALVEYHETLGSTNDRALELARQQAVALPALVLTVEQTAGRGRGTNKWSSAHGALTFSLIIDSSDELPIERLPILSLVAALAVCETLEHALPVGHAIGLKWPNDVFLDGGKVCGILTESVATPERRVVIGIGLNVNNDLEGVLPDARHRATSLVEASDKQLSLVDTLVDLLQKLFRRIEHDDISLADCSRYSMLTDQVIEVATGTESIAGHCVGIAADGALLVKDQHQTHSIYSGTVCDIR